MNVIISLRFEVPDILFYSLVYKGIVTVGEADPYFIIFDNSGLAQPKPSQKHIFFPTI